MKKLEQTKTFNLDMFPRIISENDLDAVFNVFPNTEVLKINLHFATDYILDASQKFKKLQKYCFYLNYDDHNVNNYKLNIDRLTIRCTFAESEQNSLFKLLEQFSCFRSISLYNGSLTRKIIKLLKEKELKLDNTRIDFMNRGEIIKLILENKQLKKLKLISNSYQLTPGPIITMTEILSHLFEEKMQIEVLKFKKFTLNQNAFLYLTCLEQLKNLKKITIYYNVQENTFNLDKAIIQTLSMKKIETKFIEYLSRQHFQYRPQDMKRFERKSKFYVNFVNSFNRNVSIYPLDYTKDRYQRNTQFNDTNA